MAQGLLAVQVTEGHVAEAAEQRGRDAADPADGDVPLRIARLAPRDPGVRHGHRPDAAPRGHVGADALHGPAEHARVAARRGAGPGFAAPRLGRQFGPDRVGLEVGHAVDRDRAVPVRQHDRLGHRPGPGAQVHPGGVDQRAAETEPARRIVVAADHDDAGARVPQPGQPVGAELHGVHRRDRPVVDVAGHQNGVDLLGPDDADEMIKVGGLGLAEVGPVQRAAEVPIGRVQHPHGRDTSQPQ